MVTGFKLIFRGNTVYCKQQHISHDVCACRQRHSTTYRSGIYTTVFPCGGHILYLETMPSLQKMFAKQKCFHLSWTGPSWCLSHKSQHDLWLRGRLLRRYRRENHVVWPRLEKHIHPDWKRRNADVHKNTRDKKRQRSAHFRHQIKALLLSDTNIDL